MESKFCFKCQEELSISEFNKNKIKKDGLSAYCRFHSREAVRKHLSNPDNAKKARDKKREYEHSDEFKKNRKEYLAKPEVQERIKVYRQLPEVKEKNKQRVRTYANSESGKKRIKEYRQSEAGKARDKRVKENNPTKWVARNRVGDAVRKKKIPSANSLICGCGQPSVQYHHHNGYEPDYWLDVIPVCLNCHQKLG